MLHFYSTMRETPVSTIDSFYATTVFLPIHWIIMVYIVVEFIEFEFLYTYISMYRQLHRYHLPGQLTELPVTVQLLCP